MTKSAVFFSGIPGGSGETGVTPTEPGAQIEVAFRRLTAALKTVHVGPKHLVYLNLYRTRSMPRELIEKADRGQRRDYRGRCGGSIRKAASIERTASAQFAEPAGLARAVANINNFATNATYAKPLAPAHTGVVGLR